MKNERELPFIQVNTVRDAVKVLQETFEWSAPECHWKWAKVRDVVQFLGMEGTQSECSTYGRAISSLNGGTTRTAGHQKVTWLPPLKG